MPLGPPYKCLLGWYSSPYGRTLTSSHLSYVPRGETPPWCNWNTCQPRLAMANPPLRNRMLGVSDFLIFVISIPSGQYFLICYFFFILLRNSFPHTYVRNFIHVSQINTRHQVLASWLCSALTSDKHLYHTSSLSHLRYLRTNSYWGQPPR